MVYDLFKKRSILDVYSFIESLYKTFKADWKEFVPDGKYSPSFLWSAQCAG